MIRIYAFVAFFLSSSAAIAGEPSRAELDFFEAKIRPVLVQQCQSCHSEQAKTANKLRGGLLLDSREGWIAGGDTGVAIVPGKPDQGSLLKALKYDHDVQMPPKGKLPEAVIKDFEKWIATGAADPRVRAKATIEKPKQDLASAKQFWAFQPPRSHDQPKTSTPALTKLDCFVLAKLESQQLSPAQAAEPRILIRRLYFDLIGLPPTPEQVEQYVNDPSKKHYGEIVEQLLASPAYGERWARLWLDVARYAEDQAHIVGGDTSLTYPNAYLYRDWVIQALNSDMKYSQFIQLQLAADLLEGNDSKNLAALGFIGLGPKYYDRGKLFVMAEEWEDRVDVVGRGLLGLTVACARCHDHKYDPIRTEDYYGLAGVFASTRMFNKVLPDKVGKTPAKDNKKPTDEAKKPEEALHIVREGNPTELNVFIRGDVTSKGPVTKRHFLPILSDTVKTFSQGSGRKELAEAITDAKNPLTARVIVNRVWAAYFGKGLVGTTSNFGTLGDRPTHPELLDDLAFRFVQNGSSLKWLHREIVLSATYQQSSLGDKKTTAADPDNRYLGRMPRRRLGAEGWRDALLATTGQLDQSKIGGPSIDPVDPKQTRRTVYSKISRLELNRYLAMYDFPDPNVTAEKRAETTTPLQKLFVMNSPFMIANAEKLEDKLRNEFPDETSESQMQRIDLAYRTLYGRKPTGPEIELAEKFLNNGDEKQRWKQYAHVLLAANELQFVD
jgi:hypothetical protein